MGFEVLAEAAVKKAVFWVITPCSLVEVKFTYVSEVPAASTITVIRYKI